MPVYSHSKLGTYENCPRKYKLQYIDRIERPRRARGSKPSWAAGCTKPSRNCTRS